MEMSTVTVTHFCGHQNERHIRPDDNVSRRYWEKRFCSDCYAARLRAALREEPNSCKAVARVADEEAAEYAHEVPA